MLSAQQLETYITQNLACEYIKVMGEDGSHFEAVVVSPAFVGKSMLQQHQLVYAALGDRMRAEIHALSMKTYTPEKWNEVIKNKQALNTK
ncbi:MAG: BolA family protein [Methylotenera sp.]